MRSTPSIEQFLPLQSDLGKLAYQTLQQGKGALSLAHKVVSNRLSDLVVPERDKGMELPPEVLQKITQLRQQLLETDWEDAEKGIYPVSLLFDTNWEDTLQYYPQVWLDMANVWQRVREKNYQDFQTPIDKENYPKYYLQNFHHQTDGYLSDQSANLYDLQVELLFSGTANPMRRRILAPLKEAVEAFRDTPPAQKRVLDVACGTGYTLQGIRATLPKASLYGVDLSPAYLRKANQILSQIPGELPQLLHANAEELPYLDNYFHSVTSVFLFHELPPQARQNVINEAYRVTQPGGTFIICDSIQALDSPEFAPNMKNFPIIFHEPYYRHYITDDLVKRLETAGFTEVQTMKHFMSKYWVAKKAASVA
ncbi:class I SAM-dependent methyltransferase [Spirulina sp. CS-785/01]|uniref:class I SAM-dependent methyltransferase n=1 Tax=Spirulina sp. CS-785/01 TaxID=3021716 RepID=UPI00232DD3A0|nr:class I SAM-dependent methyltransferase [Spirulina sp. CS-785/01]MDB9312341.1 class I SAM-dependent methyltransferase [Spirulina sp. CS-785/01]